MKNGYLVAALMTATALAACGGGGGGGPTVTPTTKPTIQPTNPPGATYTAKIVWSGTMQATGAGALVQSLSRRRPMDAGGSASGNVLLVSPDISVVGPMSVSQDTGETAFVSVTYSPQPSSTPSVAFTTTATTVAIQATPSPLPSDSPHPPTVLLNAGGAPNTTVSGANVVATVGAPVNQTTTKGIITYAPLTISSQSALPGEFQGGVKWDGTQWVEVSDPLQADLYWSGPQSQGLYKSSEAEATLHYPGGGVWFNSDTPFDGVTASQWSSAADNIGYTALAQRNATTSTNAILVFKTQAGTTVKIEVQELINYGLLGSAYAVSGVSPDGF